MIKRICGVKSTGLAVGLGLVLGVSGAYAVSLDLTTVPSSGTVNGAIFTTPLDEVSGTGLVDPFVRIQKTGTESGYNTDGDLEFDTKAGTWTHSLQLSDIQTNKVTVGGTDYYEFVLDINENTPTALTSMHELEIYVDEDGSSGGTSTGYSDLGTLVYDLDSGPDGDSVVELDYNNFPGSGRLDMYALIPAALFGTDLNQYIYFYSAFGDPNGSSDGFEEWATKLSGTFTCPDTDPNCGTPPGAGTMPEPNSASLALLGLGLSVVAFWVRRRRG